VTPHPQAHLHDKTNGAAMTITITAFE